MSTWKEIGEKWNRAQQMGWQAVQAAMDVGDELQQKKIETPQGEFRSRVITLGIKSAQCSRLMRLALHRELIEKSEPESMRGALALLPKVPTKTSEKQLQVHRDEIDKYEQFAKETAKKQAEILSKKMVKVELERLQNQAHDAVLTELKAVKSQLKAERKRISTLMAEAREKRQFYEDLLNKRANGHDFKKGLKILRQMAHPDKVNASLSLKTKAMKEIEELTKFLGV